MEYFATGNSAFAVERPSRLRLYTTHCCQSKRLVVTSHNAFDDVINQRAEHLVQQVNNQSVTAKRSRRRWHRSHDWA